LRKRISERHEPFLAAGDIAPALSGAIGKAALVAAFALAWASALGLASPAFVMENVRLELVVAGILTLLFCVPGKRPIAPPGTLAPLIPLIPGMVAAGVHPLALALLVSVMGLVLAKLRLFDFLAKLGGVPVKSGMLLLLGFLGIRDALRNLWRWSHVPKDAGVGLVPMDGTLMLLLYLGTGLLVWLLLRRLKLSWLIVPAMGVLALAVSALDGRWPSLVTQPGLPVLDPSGWWNGRWGLGFSLGWRALPAALPYAFLVLALWPIDALAIRTMQEQSDPVEGRHHALEMEGSFVVISIRNLVGAFLGGAQTAAVWRSFLIPLAISKRPIRGAALLLSLLVLTFSLTGYAIDLAVYPPLVWMVLLFGVFMPMCELGLRVLGKNPVPTTVIPVLLILTVGVLAGPVWGWGAGLAVEWIWDWVKTRRSNAGEEPLP
jgi:hypothetical protein